jgi:hypothetical protein
LISGRRRVLQLGVLAAASVLCACGNSASRAAENRVAGEYIVTLAPEGDAKTISDVFGRFDLRSVQPIGNGAFLVVLGDDPGLAAMQKLAAANAAIKAVQPNYHYRAR